MSVIFQVAGNWYMSTENRDIGCPNCGHGAHDGEGCLDLDYSCPKEPWPCSCKHNALNNKRIRLFGSKKEIKARAQLAPLPEKEKA